jgi:hypothetical protein
MAMWRFRLLLVLKITQESLPSHTYLGWFLQEFRLYFYNFIGLPWYCHSWEPTSNDILKFIVNLLPVGREANNSFRNT